jgi:hypothetical protein
MVLEKYPLCDTILKSRFSWQAIIKQCSRGGLYRPFFFQVTESIPFPDVSPQQSFSPACLVCGTHLILSSTYVSALFSAKNSKAQEDH